MTPSLPVDEVRATDDQRLLAQSERRWRSLVEQSPVAVVVVDGDGRFVYANANAQRLYAAAPGESLVGRRALGRVPPADRAGAEATFLSVLAGGELVQQRWRLLCLDGATVEVEVNAGQVEWAGRPAVQIQSRDMTLQAEVERAHAEQSTRWKALFTQSPVGVLVVDSHSRIVEVNDALCELLGRQRQEVVGHRTAEFLHPEDHSSRERNGELLRASADGVGRTERRIVLPTGEIRWIWITFSRSANPSAGEWTIAHIQDVTDRKAYEARLTESGAKLRAVADVAHQVHSGREALQAIVDTAARLSSAAWVSLAEPDPGLGQLRVTATTRPEMAGATVGVGATSVTAEAFLSAGVVFVGDCDHHPLVSPSLLALTGARSLLAVPVTTTSTEVGAVLVVGWDHRVDALDEGTATVVKLLGAQAGSALRQAALVAELEHHAATDALTGLPNRRAWDAALDEALVRSCATGRPLTVAVADLDHFKHFNDRHGHGAGDEVLVAVAGHLRNSLRAGDVAARWGGEEFAIVLQDCTASQASDILSRVREGLPADQTCSVGHATWDRVETAATLLQRADRALYRAKEAGRNRVAAA